MMIAHAPWPARAVHGILRLSSERDSMLRALIAALASLSASQAYACENPPMVTIPDGTTATEAALLQAQEAVRTYLVAMQDYLVCVQEEQTATGDNAPAEYKALMVKRQHAA